MNTEDPKIDKLTRELMQGTAEQPSSSLIDRIMSAVMKEKKNAQKGYVKKLPSLSGLAGILLVYLLLMAGAVYFLINNPGDVKLFAKEFSQAFPIFLTFAAGISFFFLFSQLDKWLFKRRRKPTLHI